MLQLCVYTRGEVYNAILTSQFIGRNHERLQPMSADGV